MSSLSARDRTFSRMQLHAIQPTRYFRLLIVLHRHQQLHVVSCSVLGMGLLPAVDYAAERLLVPGAVVVPACIQVGVLHH